MAPGRCSHNLQPNQTLPPDVCIACTSTTDEARCIHVTDHTSKAWCDEFVFPIYLSLSPTHTHERENNKGVTTCSTTIRNMQYLNTIFDFWIPSMKRFISFFRITTCMVYTFVQPYPYLLRVDTGSSTPYTPRMCVRSEHNLLRKLGHNLCMSSSRGVCGLASARLADVRSQPHQPEHNHLRLCLYCILTTKFRFFHLIHAYIPLSVQNIY